MLGRLQHSMMIVYLLYLKNLALRTLALINLPEPTRLDSQQLRRLYPPPPVILFALAEGKVPDCG